MQATTFRKAALGVAVLLAASVAGAQQWQFVGTRAMGMGGAGVATAFGPDAQYWNPAGLAQEEDTNETGLLINAGVSLEATKNVLEGVRNLTEMSDQYKALQTALTAGSLQSAEDISTLFKGLNDISELLGKNTGALVNADAGIGFKFKNFAVSGRALGTGAITPVVDTKNIRFTSFSGSLTDTTAQTIPARITASQILADSITANGVLAALNNLFGVSYTATQMADAIINSLPGSVTDQQILDAIGIAVDNMGGASEILNLYADANPGTTYKDNETLVMADAATFGEMSLGYGQQVIPGLKVGGNFKVISGYTAQSGVMVLTDNEDIKDILDKAYDNKKNSTNIGIDLGVMANLSQLLDKEIFWNPQFGLTARNLNSPKFDRPDLPAEFAGTAIGNNWRTDKYELKPQLRFGAAVNPFKWMTAAMDIDVTENDTMIDSIKSRQLAFGLEFNVVNGQRFNMPVRVGYNRNLSTSSVSPFYTAGIGFNMMHFYIELAGAISSRTTTIDGNSIPNSAAASLTFGFLF